MIVESSIEGRKKSLSYYLLEDASLSNEINGDYSPPSLQDIEKEYKSNGLDIQITIKQKQRRYWVSHKLV